MAFRNEYATAALLAALALALVALPGCGTGDTTPAGAAANTVTASGSGTPACSTMVRTRRSAVAMLPAKLCRSGMKATPSSTSTRWPSPVKSRP